MIGFPCSVSSYFYIRQTEEEVSGGGGGVNILAKCAAFSSTNYSIIWTKRVLVSLILQP